MVEYKITDLLCLCFYLKLIIHKNEIWPLKYMARWISRSLISGSIDFKQLGSLSCVAVFLPAAWMCNKYSKIWEIHFYFRKVCKGGIDFLVYGSWWSWYQDFEQAEYWMTQPKLKKLRCSCKFPTFLLFKQSLHLTVLGSVCHFGQVTNSLQE